METRTVREHVPWVLRALVLALLSSRAAAADPPRIPPLTSEQQQRLKERDRDGEDSKKLRAQGKLAEAIVACEKMLAIEREVFGNVHEEVAGSLEQLAEMHEQREEFTPAQKARREVLDIQTKLHGKEHWRVTDARFALAGLDQVAQLHADERRLLAEARRLDEEVEQLSKQGKFQAAIPVVRRVLAIYQKVLGPEHPNTATSLNNLGELLRVQGDYAAARPHLEQALAIQKKVLGLEHPGTATSLNNLGSLLYAKADYAGARPYYEQAFAIRKKILGVQHPETAKCLDNLGDVLEKQGDYAGARSYYEQALAIRIKMLGTQNADTGMSFNNLGGVLYAQGDDAVARSYLEQALAIWKNVLGPEHPYTVGSLHNLSVLLSEQGDDAGARRYGEQALAIAKRTLGLEHPQTAYKLHHLGRLLETQGDYAGARPYLEQALAIRKKMLAALHPDTALTLDDLGNLVFEQGDYAEARLYFEQALAIREKVSGPDHPDTATSLNFLGRLLIVQGDYAGARPYYDKALAIRQRRLGAQHPYTATSLNNLGRLLQEQGDYTGARPYFEQALAIRKKVRGPEHADTASSFNNLGCLLKVQGDYAGSRQYLEQALVIRKKARGVEHPDTAGSLYNLGGLLYAQGDHAGARPYYEQALAMARKHLDLTSSAQAEREQLLMTRSLRTMVDSYLSLGLGARLPAESVYQVVLSWKGAVLMRQRGLRVAQRHPELITLWGQFESTSRRLATLTFAMPDPKRVDFRHKQIEELTRERERLERDLQRHSAAFQKQRDLEQLTPGRLQQELPPGTALIDLLQYAHNGQPTGGKEKKKTEQHLTAFVVRPDRPIIRLDLGPAEPIAAAVERWRAGVMGDQTAPGEGEIDPAAELRRLVWQPLERYLRGVQAVLVSPDGALARFPFAALPGSKPGTYLIEDMPVAVIPVPQLLPELLAEKRAGNTAGGQLTSLFLVGDVDFSATPGKPPPDTFTGQVAMRGSRGRDFPRLPGTAGEIASIQAAFEQSHPNAAVYTVRGAEATEEAFRREACGKRYLHLATHGFFAPPELLSALVSSSNEPGDRDKTIGLNPGLLSGLALAGSNRGAQMAKDSLELSDDGILTALQVADLDLSSADLVVLSACETGLGRVAGGEGLLGLQRAFQVAGARSVVASLWKVDDQATRELMTNFYDNLWKNRLPPLEALRQAQLSILNNASDATQTRGLGALKAAPTKQRQARAHPRLWAAWVLSGDPGNLAQPLPVHGSGAAGIQAQIGGTVAGLILMLAGLSALHVRRRARGRDR